MQVTLVMPHTVPTTAASAATFSAAATPTCGIALVVGLDHLDLLAEHAAPGVPFLGGELDRVGDLLALLGQRAGERCARRRS